MCRQNFTVHRKSEKHRSTGIRLNCFRALLMINNVKNMRNLIAQMSKMLLVFI
uniref:Uncharacterized protein n=1 Tax=Manihot esculenta TaxID=3983 RepID=A0A2C9VEB6_MANES